MRSWPLRKVDDDHVSTTSDIGVSVPPGLSAIELPFSNLG